mmetsp:Transcript_8/g.14  ORF Transcript_8/g.14 Transcript_8/m.14 type:complete len:247 (-) Transcript_8:63-803(-)
MAALQTMMEDLVSGVMKNEMVVAVRAQATKMMEDATPFLVHWAEQTQQASADALAMGKKAWEDQPASLVILIGVVAALLLRCWEGCRSHPTKEPLSSEPDGVVIEESHMEVMEVACEPTMPTEHVLDVASPMRGPTSSSLGVGIIETAERQRELRELRGLRERRRSSTPPAQVRPEMESQVLAKLNSCSHAELTELKFVGPVMVNKILIQRRKGGFKSIHEVQEVLGIFGKKVVKSVEESLMPRSR